MSPARLDTSARLTRDFLWETLGPAAAEIDACLSSLSVDDDTGALYHFARLVARIGAAAPIMGELRASKVNTGEKAA